MTTVKVCTTGNTDFTDFKVFNHEPGCPCFSGSSLTPCFACASLEYPRYYRITLAGFGASACSNCDAWNGTYVLEVPTGTQLSGRCGVSMNLPCDAVGSKQTSLTVQMVEGTRLSNVLNMWGGTTDFWNIGDVITKGHYYLWVGFGNTCSQWPSYDIAGNPFCGCAAPGEDGFMGLLYLLDMGTTAPDCLRFGPVNVPLIRTTGNRDLTNCSRAWDKCSEGSVEVGSL